MRHRRPNAVGPGAAIQCARRGKSCAAELLGIQAEGMLLWRVLAHRQRAWHRLCCELVAEARLVQDFTRHTLRLSQAAARGAPLRLVHGLVDLIETVYREQEFVQLIHLYLRV